MAKLFSPLIEPIVPSFYKNSEGKINIEIPFTMNQAVSKKDIIGFVVKVKNVQSSTYLFEKKINNINNIAFSLDSQEESKLKVGLFYKFQIAYLDLKGDVGYYSTVGIGKYTTEPQVSIIGLNKGSINGNPHNFVGAYSQEGGDVTERVYSYCFNLTDENGKVISTSGWLLHNSTLDSEIYQSEDEHYFSNDLKINKTYYIQFLIKTNNGMDYASPKYRLVEKTSVNSEFNFTLEANVNYENGYVDLILTGEKDSSSVEQPATGAFLISRYDQDKSEWEEFSRFVLAAQKPSSKAWRDFTIEQGKKYTYSIQQYNEAGLYSNRILSNEIYADFEDAFLYDGNRQLKIKYNPKISSFKIDVQEGKVDTIGSKYPFIFRNGRVAYKEFPISGLISYYADEDNLFYDALRGDFKTTDPTSRNIKAEREFKLQVLDWLNNGKPKIFRSPTEGNYIVRLMNISLTPTDQLGRMLHTFNCTAYEISDFNYNNLLEYNFVRVNNNTIVTGQGGNGTSQDGNSAITNDDILESETENNTQYYWVTKSLIDVATKNNGVFNEVVLNGVSFQDIVPGSYLYIVTDQGVDYSDYDALEQYKIVIGATGSYKVDSGVQIYGIVIPDMDEDSYIKQYGNSFFTYGYEKEFSYSFNEIENVDILEIPARQFIGENDIIKQIEYIPQADGSYRKNPKIEIVEFYNINCSKRLIYNLPETTDDNFSGDMFALYYSSNGEQECLYDFYNNSIEIPIDNLSYEIILNDSNISVEDGRDFNLKRPENVKTLQVGNGVITQVSYQIRNISYSIEDTNEIVSSEKNKYLDLLKELEDLIDSGNVNISKENELRKDISIQYNKYINALIDEQIKQKEAGGLI